MYSHIVTMNSLIFASVCLSTLFVNVSTSDSRPYKILFERLTGTDDNSNYFTAKFWAAKINRTTLAAQGYMKLLKPLPEHIMTTIKIYEYFHNEYRPFPILIKKTFCALLSAEYKFMFYPDFVKGGGHFMPTSCPVKPYNYTLGNYLPDPKNFPPELPLHRIMFEYNMWDKDKMILSIIAYVKFDRDAVIRERYT